MKILLSFVIGLLIGISCRWFEVPVPAPPKLIGGLLVLSITVGYVATDRLLDRPPPQTEQRSAGPTGEAADEN